MIMFQLKQPIAESASIEMIMISSIIATPKIKVVAPSFINFISSNTRITITVLVTDIARATNRLS